MLRTLTYTSLMLAWSATLSAQILDVRELNTEQIGRFDRAKTGAIDGRHPRRARTVSPVL